MSSNPIPTPGTPQSIATVIQQVAIAALNAVNAVPTASAQNVRIGWQTQGQPKGQVTEDILYVRAAERDDEYNRIRDINTVEFDNVETPLTQYTRVWDVFYTFEGPNSFDRARIVKSALYTQTGNDLLVQANMYLVTDVIAPRYVPYVLGGQWWSRTDFEVQFNEAVQEGVLDQTVESVQVGIYDAESSPNPAASFTVTE
jgi:hypothetical protein